jgi:ribosome-associated heat shock protein Hsp15
VKAGDALVFAQNGRLICLIIEALGERRGPPAEARALYRLDDEPAPPLTSGPLG